MKYETIDHTADFGIHVFGADAKDLFANAAFVRPARHCTSITSKMLLFKMLVLRRDGRVSNPKNIEIESF